MNQKNSKAFQSERGETAYELLGNSAGPEKAAHSVAVIEIAPGGSCAKHYHPKSEESYFLLSGEGRIVIDGEEQRLRPGDCVAIPPEKTHQIFNSGGETLKFVAVCTPPWTPDCSVFLPDS